MLNAFLKNVAVFAVAASSQAVLAATIPNGQAAELAAHRLERLISTKKVEEAFLKRFAGLTVENLPTSAAGEPAFKVLISQEANSGHPASQVELQLDERGKALSFAVIPGHPASNPAVWAGKDPVTLTEVALHYLADNAANPSLSPFMSSLKALRIIPGKASGTDVALVEVLSKGVASKLTIVVSLDGRVVASNVE